MLLPWMIYAKLSEAELATGDPDAAVAAQRRALEYLPGVTDESLRGRLQARLLDFEAAAKR